MVLFIYNQENQILTEKIYWGFRKLRSNECTARVIAVFDPSKIGWLKKQSEQDHPKCINIPTNYFFTKIIYL